MSYTPHFAACRVCGKSEPSKNLVKYSTRHYAHASCAMQKWGVSFLDRLTDWQCTRFPYFVAQKHGALDELVRRCNLYEQTRQCPHGKTGDCNACNIAGDFAYDAAREDRIFGRGNR